MELDEMREHLLAMSGAAESTPFDEVSPVYKVGGKIFAILSIDALPPFVNLKCDPDRAIELREEHPEDILPGYHMNKQHWNSVQFSELPPALVKELCQHSWDLIVASLTKKARAELEAELAG
ncbi:MAG: MmcQ/YjbR family DNA-binding protein [Acidobacteria bacterium]|nr:MmcQ/YjbR family DNA-binding protein [Acidobacteriota bacterium]